MVWKSSEDAGGSKCGIGAEGSDNVERIALTALKSTVACLISFKLNELELNFSKMKLF